MTINERFRFQSKSAPDEQERFIPIPGGGPYSLSAPPAELLQMYGSFIYGKRADANLIQLYHSIPEIYSPIDAIARRAVAADFQLKRLKDDQIVYDNKQWNALLDQANIFQSFQEFLYEAITYTYVIGKNYAYKNVPETLAQKFNNVVALWNLPGDQVLPQYNYSYKLYSATEMSDIIKYYQLWDGVNSGQFSVDLVQHTKSINLDWKDRKMQGKSPLLAADIAICNLIAVYEARNVIYTKRGALGAIVSAKEDAGGHVSMTAKEKKNVRNSFDEEYGLTRRRDLFPISDVPIDFVRFGMSIQELEPFVESKTDMAMIYGVINVPSVLMPGAEGNTFSNQRDASKSVYTDTAIPICQKWCKTMSRFLGLDQLGFYIYPDFTKIDVLQENKKDLADTDNKNAQTNESLWRNGAITLNQWCVRQNLEQVAGISLYDKTIYQMTPDEQAIVKTIMSLNKPASNVTGNNAAGQNPA